MPNLSDAKKRVKQNEARRQRNRARKARLKTEMAKVGEAVQGGKLDVAAKELSRVTKLIDQTAAKGTLHRRTAARRKSRLARMINAAAKK